MNYWYTRKKSDNKATVFTLIIENNTNISSYVADWKEHYKIQVFRMNFNLLIFKI
jgi:hypothetical protein